MTLSSLRIRRGLFKGRSFYFLNVYVLFNWSGGGKGNVINLGGLCHLGTKGSTVFPESLWIQIIWHITHFEKIAWNFIQLDPLGTRIIFQANYRALTMDFNIYKINNNKINSWILPNKILYNYVFIKKSYSHTNYIWKEILKPHRRLITKRKVND